MNIVKRNLGEEAFDKFFRDCQLRNLRPASINYYKNEFHAAKKIIGKDLVDCTQKDIEDFILKSKKQTKITSINTRLRAPRSFYNYLYKQKLIQKNPMANIKLLRDRQKTVNNDLKFPNFNEMKFPIMNI